MNRRLATYVLLFVAVTGGYFLLSADFTETAVSKDPANIARLEQLQRAVPGASVALKTDSESPLDSQAFLEDEAPGELGVLPPAPLVPSDLDLSLDEQVQNAVDAGVIDVTQVDAFRAERQGLMAVRRELQVLESTEDLPGV